MTTNGILLDDDSIDFINREMSNVVLSSTAEKKSTTVCARLSIKRAAMI